MAWHRADDKTLPEPVLTQFTDAYMQHYGEILIDSWGCRNIDYPMDYSKAPWHRTCHARPLTILHLFIIGLGNGLAPIGRQAITLTIVYVLYLGPLGTNFWMKVTSKRNDLHSWKCIWKCRRQLVAIFFRPQCVAETSTQWGSCHAWPVDGAFTSEPRLWIFIVQLLRCLNDHLTLWSMLRNNDSFQ